MKTSMKINFKPQYVLTYIPKGRKTKKTMAARGVVGIENPTPMDILLEMKKQGATVTNIRLVPDCPVVIVLSWKT